MVSIPHPLRGLETPVRLPRLSAGSGHWVAAGIVLLGASAMLPVLEKSTLTRTGFALQEHQGREAALSADIKTTESEVARLTSLGRVERRAYQIGLRPPDVPLYVRVEVPGPEPAKIPAEYLPPQNAANEAPIPWWSSFLSWLPTPW